MDAAAHRSRAIAETLQASSGREERADAGEHDQDRPGAHETGQATVEVSAQRLDRDVGDPETHPRSRPQQHAALGANLGSRCEKTNSRPSASAPLSKKIIPTNGYSEWLPAPVPVTARRASETATRTTPNHWRRPRSNPKKRSRGRRGAQSRRRGRPERGRAEGGRSRRRGHRTPPPRLPSRSSTTSSGRGRWRCAANGEGHRKVAHRPRAGASSGRGDEHARPAEHRLSPHSPVSACPRGGPRAAFATAAETVSLPLYLSLKKGEETFRGLSGAVDGPPAAPAGAPQLQAALHLSRVPRRAARPRLCCFRLAIPWRRRGDELVEELHGGSGYGFDGAVERHGVRPGGLGVAAHLADVLEGGRAGFLLGRRGIEIVEGSYVAAHAHRLDPDRRGSKGAVLRRQGQVPSVRGRPLTSSRLEGA